MLPEGGVEPLGWCLGGVGAWGLRIVPLSFPETLPLFPPSPSPAEMGKFIFNRDHSRWLFSEADILVTTFPPRSFLFYCCK